MRGLHLFLQIFSIFIFFPVNLLSIDLSSISPDGSVTNISSDGEWPWTLSTYNEQPAVIPMVISNTNTTSILTISIDYNEPNCIYYLAFKYTYSLSEDDSYYLSLNNIGLFGFRGMPNPGLQKIRIKTPNTNIFKFIYSRDEDSNRYGGYIYDVKLEKVYLNSEMWTSEGTEQDPYLIKNYADLNEIAQKTLLGESFEDKYFRLNNDITVNTDITASNASRIIWTPIGNNTTPFAGNFDGNNFTVSGVYCEGNNTDTVGFFGKINNAYIKNLIIENSSIKGGGNVGGLVGYSLQSKIINCSFDGDVLCYDYRQQTGGIVGFCQDSELYMCKNYSLVHSEMAWFNGGIAGRSINSIFNNCINMGTISFRHESRYIGGIIGSSSEDKIYNCVNEGAIYCPYESFYVGGIVGWSFSTIIENTYNIAQVLGNYIVGGLSGHFGGGDIKNCYNKGSVIAHGSGERGSIFGRSTGWKMENCYYLDNSVTDMYGNIGATNYSGTPFNTDQKLYSTCLINNVACYYLTDALNTWVEYKNLPDKYISWEKIQHINDDYPIHKNKVSNINAYYEISTTFGNGGKALTNYTRSSEGNSANLIIYPNAGYETSSVTMNGVDITNQVTDNQYSWVQPNENIEFDVIFRETSVYSDLGKEGYSELIKIYSLNGENLLLVIPEKYIGGNLFVYDTTGSIMVNELINNTMMIVKSKPMNGIYIASIKAGALIQNQTFFIR